jgi:hypothetical protein
MPAPFGLSVEVEDAEDEVPVDEVAPALVTVATLARLDTAALAALSTLVS